MKYGIQKQDMEEYFYKDNKKENMMGDLSISNLSNYLNNNKLIIQNKALFENIKVFHLKYVVQANLLNKKIDKRKKKVIYEKLFQLLKKIKKDLKNRKEEELQKIKKKKKIQVMNFYFQFLLLNFILIMVILFIFQII